MTSTGTSMVSRELRRIVFGSAVCAGGVAGAGVLRPGMLAIVQFAPEWLQRYGPLGLPCAVTSIGTKGNITKRFGASVVGSANKGCRRKPRKEVVSSRPGVC